MPQLAAVVVAVAALGVVVVVVVALVADCRQWQVVPGYGCPSCEY